MSITFNIHKSIIIRLENASTDDAKAIAKQLGIEPIDSNHEPDILITYVDKFSTPDPIRHLAKGQAAYTEQEFLLLQGGKRVIVSLEQIGQGCEVQVEHGIGSIPELVSLINLTALSKGILPLHASAFVYEGVGVLATGWPKGGKTSALFSFLANQARFVSDDWAYVYPEGEVKGLALPVKLSDWQLEHLPQYSAFVSRKKHRKMGSVRRIDQFNKALSNSRVKNFFPVKFFNLATRYLNNNQRHIYMSVDQILLGAPLSACTFDVLLLPVSHDSETIIVEATTSETGLEMALSALSYEWSEFMDYYKQYRYAFPDKHNAIIEALEEKNRALLTAIMKDKPVYTVRHPRPVNLQELYEAIRPHILHHRK